MNYTSTRGTVVVNETYALLHGLAEDGGLYHLYFLQTA